MNPNYLSKKELIYKLSLRGINTDGEVQWLRKLFRTVMVRDAVPEARRLRGWDVNELYSYAYNPPGYSVGRYVFFSRNLSGRR